MINILTFIKHIVFPPRCVFCDRIMEPNCASEVCGECSDEIKFCSHRVCCQKCGKPLVSFGKKPICYYCLDKKTKYFDRIVSVFEYDGIVRESILRYKTSGIRKYAKTYAECMAARFFEEYSDTGFDFICAVPSHTDKKTLYGFDQVELLCRNLSKITDIEYRSEVLKKTRRTKRQSSLNYTERQKNIENSMVAVNAESVNGKTVLLIDDICTTRATLIECSRALKKAGAKTVCALTLATTLRC